MIRFHGADHRACAREGLPQQAEKGRHDEVEKTELVLRRPRLVAVHQKRDALPPELLFLVALREELLLEPARPAQVGAPTERQVPHICALQRQLQCQGALSGCCCREGAVTGRVGRRCAPAVDHVFESLLDPSVLGHVRGQDHVHDQRPKLPEFCLAQRLQEVVTWLEEQAEGRSHVVLLIRAPVIVHNGFRIGRLDHEVVRYTLMLEVVHHGCQQASEHHELRPPRPILDRIRRCGGRLGDATVQ
mmetsp:Transcript_119564/g.298190  ORF Transcript_119564/g.298190 Transcript_119564/m.298190 type:complete len:246 (-) Transcript_119564:1390-2127(-)